MKNFEARLEKLEKLGEKVRDSDVPLDEALQAFEEGIKLAHTLEQDLAKAESRIELLLNDVQSGEGEKAELSLFDAES